MRQVHLLEQGYRVTVVGFGQKPEANVEFIPLAKPPAGLLQKGIWATKLLLGAFESYYWSLPHVRHALQLLSGRAFDLVVANDISALPLGLRLAKQRPVLMDAHEYSPKEFDDKWLWKLLFGRYHHSFCEQYLSRAAGMVTVCQGIADEYERTFGVSCKVVHNAPLDQNLIASPVKEQQIRLIHHGSSIRSRHLEVMIEMMKYLDNRFSLDLMLVETDAVYMAELRRQASSDARIRFIAPVAMQAICARLNDYDMGVYLLPPVNFNHEHALPNKFFEFIQARLAIAIGPSPEMAALVRKYQCGIVTESFEPRGLAQAIGALAAEDIIRFKKAADFAARELSYERDGQVLLSEIDRLLASSAPEMVTV